MEIKTKTGQDLKEMLVEMSAYYFKLAKESDRSRTNVKSYKAGFNDGASEAIDAIIFNLYGGEFAFKNWMKNIGKDADESVIASMKYGHMNGNDKDTSG